jgi:hypothetical protein
MPFFYPVLAAIQIGKKFNVMDKTSLIGRENERKRLFVLKLTTIYLDFDLHRYV